MFRSKILTALVAFGFVVVSLSSCNQPASKSTAKSTEEDIINKEVFLKVHARCTSPSVDRTTCVKDVFDLRVKDYCAERELSAMTSECKEIQVRTESKMKDYFREQVLDAFKSMQK